MISYILDKYKIQNMSAAKKQRTTRAEEEKLLEEFYKNLGNETFLGHAFIVEGEDLGKPDSSSDEDNDEESIANEEEIETSLQEADFETPETMDVHEEEVEESLLRKQKFKNLDEVVKEKNYDELQQ